MHTFASNHRLAATVALCSALTYFSSAQDAAADLECLSGSTGRTVVWNAAWQPDGSDPGVPYTITNVVHVRTMESHSVQLELLAAPAKAGELSGAKLARRVLVVKESSAADQICSSLAAVAAPPSILNESNPAGEIGGAGESTGPAPIDSTVKSEERFIRYTASGWVRDDPPPKKTLVICPVAGRAFACLPEDKERYGATLKLLEEQLKYESR